MDTIKTALVVTLLLAVLYGVYVVLNKEPAAPPPEVAQIMESTQQDDLLMPPEIDMGFSEGTGTAADAHGGHDHSHMPSSTSSTNPQSRIYVKVEPMEGQNSSPAKASPPAESTALQEAPSAYASVKPPRGDQVGLDVSKENPAATHESSPSVPVDPLLPRSVPADLQGYGRSSQPRSPASGPAAAGSASADSRYAGGGNGAVPAPGAREAASDLPSNPVPPNERGDSGGGSANGSPDRSATSTASGGESTKPSAQLGAPSFATETAEDPGTAFAEGATGSDGSGSRYGTQAQGLTVAAAIPAARELVSQGKYVDALRSLSRAYYAAELRGELAAPDRQAALDMLDPLAAKVIYSREHLLMPAHTARPGETLSDVAARYKIPVQLLENINGLRADEPLPAGTSIKVVSGPFQADVDLDQMELTLYVDGLYGGRFPISVGSAPHPVPGEYIVLAKQAGHTFQGADGRTIPSTDPTNPYGSVWIDLGNNGMCIHGSPRVATNTSAAGCIGLSPRDADDVYGILSQGSRVTVRY